MAALLAGFVARTPGAFVEEKTSSLAFHYRGADPATATARVLELRATLEAEGSADYEVLEGSRVLEVRLAGVQKGLVAAALTADVPAGTAVFAAGDDNTDEDLFAALSPESVTVRVGPGRSRARFRVPDVRALRTLLESLL